jgi:hypothetical protein
VAAWWAEIASTSWLLRIRPVPLMPRPEATAWSSGSSMVERPPLRLRVPDEVLVEGVAAAAAEVVSS